MPAPQRRTRQDWIDILRRLDASSLDAAEFAKEEDVNVKTLRWWKSQLKGKRNRASLARARRAVEADHAAGLRPLTVRLVNQLSAGPGVTSSALASELEATIEAVRAELLELEDLGIVYRKGYGRWTLWFVG